MSITFETKLSEKIQGLRIITPSVFEESRGSIWTSYNTDQLEKFLPEDLFFKHDKFSCSKHNVLRGIHGDNKSWKLVSCISGSIMQVVVDMRPQSGTYLAHECFDLGSHNHQMILIPPKLGNAFYVNSESAIYHYKLAYKGDYADYDQQFTVAWNDPRLKINWPTLNPILSERDSRL
jgi:dTDP-4-dehydrorhamnose 3,5-epimerase